MPLADRLRLPALCFALLLSGASALVFETLWFRQAGLVLGNAVVSSSLVLAAFMAGLALGNGLGGLVGARLRRPLLAYAALEVLVGVSGAALVAGLPALTPLLVPALRAAAPTPGLLDLLRASTAFALLVVPASAMGLTLPVLVEALRRDDRRFAWTLGQLYGWNTLGAVIGALLGELALIGWLGLRGTGLVAAAFNLSAATIALVLHRLTRSSPPVEATGDPAVPAPGAAPLGPLGAAFVAGGLLLALEVVWFRLLLLSVIGTSRTFAVMLAVVLAGIAGGGLLASWLARRGLDGRRAATAVGFLAGAATAVSYAVFPAVLARAAAGAVSSIGGVLALAGPLMLPTCLLSGLLFPLLGEGVRLGRRSDAGAAGLLTLANTLGAMAGALLGGFLLLPHLGVERSVYVLSLAYAAVGLLALPTAARAGAGMRRLGPALASASALVATLALFPFGSMGSRILPVTLSRWVDLRAPGVDILAVREGLTETAVLIRESRWGTPVSYRLLTNAFSMAALNSHMGRYMKAFVYLPAALHPDMRSALLISYGVGGTAKALTDTRSLATIDIVDISKNVIEAARGVYPEPGASPVDDPRTRLHIEDGRFFLLTTRERFDLITAEPPPPNAAGVQTLYSREYFSLVRDRLAEGGIVSYWLPVYQMRLRDSQSIVVAFCAAFPDCTLWSGSGAEWMLLGTRNARPVSEEGFSRQWRDPRVRETLAAYGFEQPEDLAMTFLAGSDDLAGWTAGVAPLDDDHPHRIAPEVETPPIDPYLEFANPLAARERFARSPFVRRVWPESLRERTLVSFEAKAPVLWAGWRNHGAPKAGLRELQQLLTDTSVRTGVLWLMGSDPFEESAARRRGDGEPEVDEVLGIAAMADRDFRRAEALLARAQAHAASPGRLVAWRVLALCLAGDTKAAAAAGGDFALAPTEDASGWQSVRERCGLATVPPPQ